MTPRGNTLSDTRSELAFLAARIFHGDHTWVGLSSNAMVQVAMEGGEPSDWPADDGDLRRCEETYRRAPEHLKPRLLPTLERFRRHAVQGYRLYCRGCDQSGKDSLVRGLCRKCRRTP